MLATLNRHRDKGLQILDVPCNFVRLRKLGWQVGRRLVPGIVRAPLHALKDGGVVGCGIEKRRSEALRHDFATEPLNDVVEENLLHDTLPSRARFRVETYDCWSEILIGMVVATGSERRELLSYLVYALRNNPFQLPWLMGWFDKTEPVVAGAAHPFPMPSDTDPARRRPQQVMEHDVVGENNDLTAYGCFLGKTLGHSLHTAMVERGDRIVDDDSVVATDLLQFRQKARQRETALLALTQDVAFVANPLPGIEIDLNDTLGLLATIGQVQREVRKLEPFEFPVQPRPQSRSEDFATTIGDAARDSGQAALPDTCV